MGLFPSLMEFARKIKKEKNNAKDGRNEILLHFVTSNVPDLDDEHDIRNNLLKRFQKELGYQELTATIHHYPSLALLNQDVFTQDRPNSRLANQYKKLTVEVQKCNPEDKKGAISFIREYTDSRREPFSYRTQHSAEQASKRIDNILKKHGKDIDILKAVISLKEQQGRFEEMDALLYPVFRYCSE